MSSLSSLGLQSWCFGLAPQASGFTAPLNPDRTAWDRMGYRERLALKRENPEAYREMKKY